MLTGLGFAIAAVSAAIRVLYAVGREKALPASLARLSCRQTPAVAIDCVAALALVLGLLLTYAGGGVHLPSVSDKGRPWRDADGP